MLLYWKIDKTKKEGMKESKNEQRNEKTNEMSKNLNVMETIELDVGKYVS